MSAVTKLLTRIKAQVGKLYLPVLLDSGPVRSLISSDHSLQISDVEPNLQLLTTDLTCIIALGQIFRNCGSG